MSPQNRFGTVIAMALMEPHAKTPMHGGNRDQRTMELIVGLKSMTSEKHLCPITI